MTRHLCLIPVVCLLLAASGPGAESEKEDSAAKDLAKIQGKWREVEEDSDGVVTKNDRVLITSFEKDVETDYDVEGGVAAKCRVKLDPSKSPKEIDQTLTFNVLFPKEKGKTIQGIYQLEGDELRVAFPWAGFRERPKEFTTKKGNHFAVVTYKRVKE